MINLKTPFEKMAKNTSLGEKARKTFVENFQESVQKNKKLLLSVLSIFLLAIGISIFANQIGPNPISELIETQTEPLKRMLTIEGQKERTILEWITFFVRNNLTAATQTIGLGTAFGVFSLYSLLLNGFVVGFITSQSTAPLETGLALLLPHGVFEITGYMLASTCGIRLGIGSIKSLLNREAKALKKAGREVKYLIPPVILLIIIAAIIEGLLGTYQEIILNSSNVRLALIGGSIISFSVLFIWISGILPRSSHNISKQ